MNILNINVDKHNLNIYRSYWNVYTESNRF